MDKKISQFLFGSISFLLIIITDFISCNIRSNIGIADFSKYVKTDKFFSIILSTYFSVGIMWILTAVFILLFFLLFRKKLSNSLILKLEIIYIAIRPILMLAILIVIHYARTIPVANLTSIDNYYKIAFITIDNIKFFKEYGISLSYVPIIALSVAFVYKLFKYGLSKKVK